PRALHGAIPISTDNGSRTVKGKIRDKDGGFSEYTASVTINNVAPTVNAAANQFSNEGSSTSFSLGSFSDPGVNDNPWAVDVNWGDSSSHTTFNAGSQGALGIENHTYADNGTYTVTVQVTDKDGAFDSKTFQVTVANVPPTVTAGANQSSFARPHTSFHLGSFTDPGVNDAPWHVSVDWGDGSPATTFTTSSPGALAAQHHTYADGPHAYTVAVTVTDKDGGTGSASYTATIINVPPTVTAAANQSSDQNTDAKCTLGSFTDPGANDGPWHVSVDWGDGSPATTFDAASPGALAAQHHTYADGPHDYTVTVTVTDKDTGSDHKSFSVHVNNVPPAVAAAANQSAFEGTDTSFQLGSFTDPGVNDAPWHVSVDWGDGSAHTTFNASTQGALGSKNHTYADNTPGGYTVTVTVTDKDSGSDSKSFNVDVHNVAPAVTAAADQTSNEGENHNFSLGSFSDPGVNDHPWAVDVDWGDGTPHTTFSTNTQGGLGTQDHTYADNKTGGYTVTVKVTDKDSGTDSKTFNVDVHNVPPAVTAAANQSSDEGSSASFDLGSFTDPGANDAPWAVDVNWGDGSAHTTFNASTQGALGSKNHTYADNTPGGYTVTVTVTDKDSGSDSKSFNVDVHNVAPTVTAAGNQSAFEGTDTSLNLGSFSDPGANDAPW